MRWTPKPRRYEAAAKRRLKYCLWPVKDEHTGTWYWLHWLVVSYKWVGNRWDVVSIRPSTYDDHEMVKTYGRLDP